MPASLIVDAGFSATHVVPIFGSAALNYGIKRLGLGGKLLTNHLKQVISYRAYNVPKSTAPVGPGLRTPPSRVPDRRARLSPWRRSWRRRTSSTTSRRPPPPAPLPPPHRPTPRPRFRPHRPPPSCAQPLPAAALPAAALPEAALPEAALQRAPPAPQERLCYVSLDFDADLALTRFRGKKNTIRREFVMPDYVNSMRGTPKTQPAPHTSATRPRHEQANLR